MISISITADAVHSLSTLKSYESMVVTEPAETVVNQTCDNSETVAHTDKHNEIDSQSADAVTLTNQQKAYPALVKYFDVARHGH
jgi:hypothetical protein